LHVAAVSGIDDAEANSAIVKNLADVVAEFARIGGDWHFTPLYLEKVEDAGFREKLTVYFEASDYKSILLTRVEDAKGLLAVIGYERRQDASYAPTDLQFLQGYAKLAAKALRRAEDFRCLPAIGAVKKLQSIKEKAFGPQRHRFFVKIAVAVLVAAVLGLGRMDLTVRGDCRIVPYLTTIASPRISGTVREIAAKQGDAVKKGDTIALLDDREINLSIKQVQASIQQTEASIDMLFAANDTRWAIETKNLDIFKVRLDALELQKEFTRIVSPQDGVIMTRQDLLMASLGASVQRGQAICEIADLSRLAVEVNVSERDVSLVKVGQRVNYSLSGAPGRTFSADIDRVSPMTQQVFGKNVFIAEARIASPEAVMRPGITGSAGIPVGKRPLVYVVFRSTIDWLRTKFL
jgi:RND family efflux transporter MFP subunit